MSDQHNQPRDPSFGANDEPEVFIGEPQPYLTGPEDARTAPGEGQPVPADRAGDAQATRQRRIHVPAVAAALVVLALILGGIGGYVLGRGSHDVSVSGQVSYACALIENVQRDHAAPEDWGDIFEDQAWRNVSAASTLFGGFLPSDGEEDEFQDVGGQLLFAMSRVDAEALVTAVEAAQRECEDL